MATIYYDLTMAVVSPSEVLQLRDPTIPTESLRTNDAAVASVFHKRRVAAGASVGATTIEAVGEVTPFSLNIVVR